MAVFEYKEFQYGAELRARMERYDDWPRDERPLFVIAEQTGGSGAPSTVQLQGPWHIDQFDWEWGPGQVRSPLGEIELEMVTGFFEVQQDAHGVEEGVAYTQDWPQAPDKIGRQATAEESLRALGH